MILKNTAPSLYLSQVISLYIIMISTFFLFFAAHSAIKRKCTNAMHPDQYGHYREAKFTQTKHHWWWKANRVFNELDVVSNYSGII